MFDGIVRLFRASAHGNSMVDVSMVSILSKILIQIQERGIGDPAGKVDWTRDVCGVHLWIMLRYLRAFLMMQWYLVT